MFPHAISSRRYTLTGLSGSPAPSSTTHGSEGSFVATTRPTLGTISLAIPLRPDCVS